MPSLSAWKAKQFVFSSLATNIFRRGKLAYIVEARDWAIYQVGKQLTHQLRAQQLINGFITATPWLLTPRLIHFGSAHAASQLSMIDKSNRVVVTIFHLVPQKTNRQKLMAIADRADIIHTANSLTKQRLIEYGLGRKRIVVIPLGIDLSLFRPTSPEGATTARQKLHIDDGAVVVGSFQKDGVGWQEGNEPKLEKGPDILVEVASQLKKRYPIHILLVGPARGYVKTELKRRGIPYTHVGHVSTLKEVAPLYAALDLYLITSRFEGGPLSLLEAWASHVPVVSTPVGMVADSAQHEKNALIAPVEDIPALVQQACRVIDNIPLRRQLVEAAAATVVNYSWNEIARRYYEHLYKPLLPVL